MQGPTRAYVGSVHTLSIMKQRHEAVEVTFQAIVASRPKATQPSESAVGAPDINHRSLAQVVHLIAVSCIEASRKIPKVYAILSA